MARGGVFQPSTTLFSMGSTVTPLLRRNAIALFTSASGPLNRTAMMPISFWTLAWRMSKETFGNVRLICQMIGCSTWVRVGKVNLLCLALGSGMMGEILHFGALNVDGARAS